MSAVRLELHFVVVQKALDYFSNPPKRVGPGVQLGILSEANQGFLRIAWEIDLARRLRYGCSVLKIE